MSEVEKVDINIAPAPELSPVAMARLVLGTACEILDGMGISASADIKVVEPDSADKDKLFKAINRHTAALAYVVNTYGLTKDYVEKRAKSAKSE